MSRPHAIRIVAAILVPLLAIAGSGRGVLADTSSQAGVSIEIVDEGSLGVAWGSGTSSFLVAGEPPALTASTPSVTATTTLDLVVDDTRADDNRSGYTISLAATDFSADGAGSTISPSQLMVVAADGAPAGVSAATSVGQTLDAPVRLVTVAAGATAVNATLTVTVAMTIYAGTTPGSYTGGFTFEVLPLAAP